MAIKINTNYWAKPIPDRSCDWSATYDDYDGAEDSGNRHMVGLGATEQEAIDDLTENWPRGTTVPIKHDDTDRMRTALQLIASLPAGLKDNDRELLDMAVLAASAALEDEHDAMCEVLR